MRANITRVQAPWVRRLREVVGVPELAIVLVSYAVFVYYLSASYDTNLFDELHYLLMTQLLSAPDLLAETGLHGARTYLYPWLLTALLPITGWNPPVLKILVAMLQYAALVATVLALAVCIGPGDAQRAPAARRTVLVLGLWNPYLIQATTLLLTDALAACAIAGSLLAAWRCDLGRLRGALASVGLAAAAAALRPAALPALVFVAGTIALRSVARGDVVWRRFGWRGALALAPLLAQLALNVRYFGLWTVLPAAPMYSLQRMWAVHRLRYVTSVDPASPSAIIYANPIAIAPHETIYSAIVNEPTAFVVAIGAHLFHVLDWGYIHVYVPDLYALSRLVGSVFVYTAWAIIALGAISVVRRWWRSAIRLERDGLWLALGMATLLYAGFTATTQMETRYAYPTMLLALPFAGPGGLALLDWLRAGPGHWLAAGFAWALACAGLLYLSLWLDLTTGKIDWFAHYLG